MIAFKTPVAPPRNEAIFPRMTSDDIYFTRFDTHETGEEFVFCCTMPDVQLMQLETKVRNGELTIQGTVRRVSEGTETRTSPKPWGFFRSFPIEHEVQADQISAC